MYLNLICLEICLYKITRMTASLKSAQKKLKEGKSNIYLSHRIKDSCKYIYEPVLIQQIVIDFETILE